MSTSDESNSKVKDMNEKPEEVVKSEDKISESKTIVVKKREPKNWDKIVKQFEDEEKSEPQNADDVFRKLYSDADDDTRRAMNKSFLESNGTTLSMDWKKVGKKFVKPYEDKDSGDESLSDSDEDMEGMQRFRLKDPKKCH